MALLAVVLSVAAGGLAARANAAIYWVDDGGIGRMNLDGSNPSPGVVPRAAFIGAVCGLAVDDSHIYWASKFDHSIGRVDPNGDNLEPEFIVGADQPCGVAVDEDFIYWANEEGDSIGRARIDGTEVDQNFVSEVPRPCGVAVTRDFIYWPGGGYSGYIGRAERDTGARRSDIAIFDPPLDYYFCGIAASERHVFWGGFGEAAIGRVSIDGSEPEPQFIADVQRPCSLTIFDEKLYWTELTGTSGLFGHVSRANLDGSAREPEIRTALRYPCGIAVDSRVFGPSYIAPPPLPNWTPCKIDRVRANKWNGTALVRLYGPTYGRFRVRNGGLHSRVISKRPPTSGARPAAWRWWVRIWPRGKGRAGRGLRARLANRGRAPLKLRISCTERGSVDNVDTKRLVLHKRAVHRKRHQHMRRSR